MRKKANYGIDAPGVIRNLLFFGALGFLVPLFFPRINIGEVSLNLSGFILMGICCTAMALWMYVYSTYGKMRHRNRILNMVDWNGNEKVLDVGTGRGLMLIGAAKRLSVGRATGIDVWNAEDLTSNNAGNVMENARIEGVGDKVEVRNENAMQMSFEDKTFDVVLSNLCLHNIYDEEGRKTACHEIARVLKPGGVALISDFRHMKAYKRYFQELGMKTKMLDASAFPPLPVLIVKH